MTEAYPLQWPAHVKRRPAHRREHSRFDVTPDIARRALRNEAERMGSHVVISTNVELRRDGEPYASRKAPEDTGVAVYFMRKGGSVCIACDKYVHVWENMRGIQKTIEAMRGIERWGSSDLLDQAFRGFTALPSPDAMVTPPATKGWWEILGVSSDASGDDVRAAYKTRAREFGGATVELNQAKQDGLRAASR